jgi:hypothetical protein
MAIRYLNNISLEGNQIQNVRLQNLGSDPTALGAGQIIYNTATNSLKYWNGTVWINLDGSGDISEVIAGAGLTGGGDIGAVTLNVGAGTGIAVGADTVSLSHLGLENLTDPGADRIFFWDDSANASDWLEVSTATGITISGTTLQLASIPNASLTNSSVTVAAGAGLTDGGTVALGATVTLNVGAGTGITVNANDIAIKNAGALSNNTVPKWTTASGQLANSLITDDGTTVVIGGNLTVNGTTTTINSTIVSIADNMMQYASGNVANSVDIGFFGNYVNSGTKYATFFYDASASSASEATFTLGHTPTLPTTTVTDFTLGRLVANITGNVTGNASTATALATARTISITGDATWTVTFDGSANVTSALTLANSGVTAGTYGSASSVAQVTFDAKGRATSASSVAIAITASQVTDFTAAVQAIIGTYGAVANVGDGSSTIFDVVHNLGTRDVIVQVYDNATYETVFVDVARTNTSTLALTFATAPALNAYRVLVQAVS